MIEFIIISASVAWMFFVLFSKHFDYLDERKTKK